VTVPSHFEIFGLPASFDLDARTLEDQYRALSLELHPDRARGGDARERRVALEKSTALNDAFKVLKDPVKRAFHLLKLHGLDLEKEDAGANKQLPLEFLEEVMDLRERLHEARAAKDVETALKMGADVEKKQREALESAAASLRVLEGAADDEGARKNAAHQLSRVRYFTRFLEEVSLIEEEALG
jgi:molecular chaperone HscB